MKPHWQTFYVVLSISSYFTKRNFDFFCEFSPLIEVKELLTLHLLGVESLRNYLVYHKQTYIP